MSDYFKVVASTGEYGVQIGNGLLSSKIGNPEQQIIICDQFFAHTYQSLGLKVIGIEAVETSKSLDQMTQIVVALRTLGANRSTIVLAIGGGVIQDIATFVSSLYMRGLKWEYFPTTLLGMVDSCIGGKSSINVGKYKNLIGNFYPPENVLIDLQFINTLSTGQRAAGLCEAIKICFADTGDAFDRYIALNPHTASSPEVFHDVISLSLLTKRWFVEIDEHDHKERQLLNFGHTFGHAIEGASNYSIPHGIAVGMGVLAAIECAHLLGHYATEPKRVATLERYTTALLATIADLPLWTRQLVVDELMDHFNADKKHTTSHYAVIVPDATGHLIRLELEKSDANRDLILASLRKVCQNTSVAV